MGMSIDELKKECQYCCREIDNSGLEGFLCTNGNAIKARDSILCDPKNANEPCSICEYCKPGEEPAKQQKMDINECITWLKILRANMNTFSEISAEKKIEALTMAIKALEQEQTTKNDSSATRKNSEKFESEWEQDHAILNAYSDGAKDILDKIRAEIIELTKCPYGNLHMV